MKYRAVMERNGITTIGPCRKTAKWAANAVVRKAIKGGTVDGYTRLVIRDEIGEFCIAHGDSAFDAAEDVGSLVAEAARRP